MNTHLKAEKVVNSLLTTSKLGGDTSLKQLIVQLQPWLNDVMAGYLKSWRAIIDGYAAGGIE